MGSTLTLVNNTSDSWQCKIGPQTQIYNHVDTIIMKAIGVISSLITTTVLVFASSGAITVSGVPASAMEDISPVTANATNATIIQNVSAFGVNLANAISSELLKQNFVVIQPGTSHRSGWMSLSSWQQSQCIRVVIIDERKVRVDTLEMRPIYSGITHNSNINYEMKHWIKMMGTHSETIEAKV